MKKMRILASAVLCAVLLIPAFSAIRRAQAAEGQTELYYLEAEVVEILEETTRFGHVDGPEPSSLTYETPGNYDDSIPYLLTMDSMGTEDPSDDEILVVWGCMSGAA